MIYHDARKVLDLITPPRTDGVYKLIANSFWMLDKNNDIIFNIELCTKSEKEIRNMVSKVPYAFDYTFLSAVWIRQC